MNTDHSPAPWNVTRHGTPAHTPQYGVYSEECPRDLAIVTGPNAKADARLIAAAPDLLEALKIMVATIGLPDSTAAKIGEEKARAAIAKATAP